MDEEIERLTIGVRADVGGFAGDVAGMRASLIDGLGQGASRAGGLVEQALARAIRTGRLGFEDLRRVALATMADIAGSAVSGGLGSLLGGTGLGGIAGRLAGTALGLPGRATGGPVGPGRAYVVGERGPELFVPTSSGEVRAGGGAGGGRDVRVAITVHAPAGDAGAALSRSARQVARAVRAAIEGAE